MKTAFMKIIIEDLQVKNCEQKQIDALLNCYEDIVKRMAAMLARTATFETDDFFRAKERGIAGFLNGALNGDAKATITTVGLLIDFKCADDIKDNAAPLSEHEMDLLKTHLTTERGEDAK